MYVYACTYKHPDGRLSYYVGKHEEPYEKSGWYLGSGNFCKYFKEKYGSKYTKKNVVKKILMHSLPNRKVLCQWEKIFIESYRQIYGNLCKNQSDGGDGNASPWTEERRARMKKIHKSPEWRAKMKEISNSPEHKANMIKRIKDLWKSPEHRARMSNRNKGSKNPRYNHTSYSFRNIVTGKIYIGTQRMFIERYNLCQASVSDLIRKRIKRHREWVLSESDIYSEKDAQRIRSEARRDKTIHKFRHKKTGETYVGTKYDFRLKYGLRQTCVNRIVTGERKSYKGWVKEQGK